MHVLFGRPTLPAVHYKQEFSSRIQGSDETFSQYAFALSELGRKAYPNVDADMVSAFVRDQFTLGVNDLTVYDRLLQVNPNT